MARFILVVLAIIGLSSLALFALNIWLGFLENRPKPAAYTTMTDSEQEPDYNPLASVEDWDIQKN